MGHSTSGSPRRHVRAEDRCIDCFRPTPHLLCDACIARLQATPVPGERLPWERGFDALVADMKDHAIWSDDATMALAALYVEDDDHTHPSHTSVVLNAFVETVAPKITEAAAGGLRHEGSMSMVAGYAAELISHARMVTRVAKLLLRGATYAARDNGGDIERRFREVGK